MQNGTFRKPKKAVLQHAGNQAVAHGGRNGAEIQPVRLRRDAGAVLPENGGRETI